MLPIVSLDDEPMQHAILKDMLQRALTQLNLAGEVVLSTDNPQAVLDYAQKAQTPALYLLDIDLGGETSGLEVAQALHRIDPRSYVVYVSAHERFAMECLHTHAFDFLLKPVTYEAAAACLRGILRDMRTRQGGQGLAVVVGSRALVIPQEEIYYIRTKGNDLVAVTEKGNYQWRGSLQRLEGELTPGAFVRIHRQTLCALRFIGEVDWTENTLTMLNGDQLEISRRLAANLKEQLLPGGSKAP